MSYYQWEYERSATNYYHIFSFDDPLNVGSITVDAPETPEYTNFVENITNDLNAIAESEAKQ